MLNSDPKQTLIKPSVVAIRTSCIENACTTMFVFIL